MNNKLGVYNETWEKKARTYSAKVAVYKVALCTERDKIEWLLWNNNNNKEGQRDRERIIYMKDQT